MRRYGAMATAMIYDTLKLAEQLEYEAGFDPARARAMARILAENAGGNVATPEDLFMVKAELEASIRAVEGRVGGLEGKVRVLYWVSGTTLAGVAALLGIAITVALHVMHLE
jgi:hypothetical protein